MLGAETMLTGAAEGVKKQLMGQSWFVTDLPPLKIFPKVACVSLGNVMDDT
jgi:hypothetical protein